MSPDRRQFMLALEMALRRQVAGSASSSVASSSSANCNNTPDELKQGQLNLDSVPNSNSSPTSSSQADDSQSEEQEAHQFLTDESTTPCQSPETNNNPNKLRETSPKMVVTSGYRFERASLRRSSHRLRPIKRSSKRRRSRRAQQVRFEPIPHAIEPMQHTTTHQAQPVASQHRNQFEANAKRHVIELKRGLNKLGNRVNFRKLKLKKFNLLAQNLQQKISQSKSALKHKHMRFQHQGARANQEASPKAASYDLVSQQHNNQFSESQFEPVQCGRYGFRHEDELELSEPTAEDWGSDFDQSDSEAEHNEPMSSTARKPAQLGKSDLSLRQLVIDVIDNCEKPSKLSNLTRSNSLSSNLSSSREDLSSTEQASPGRGYTEVVHNEMNQSYTTIDHSLSSLGTIDGLEYRPESISLEPEQSNYSGSNSDQNEVKISLKKYLTQGWRDFSKLRLSMFKFKLTD